MVQTCNQNNIEIAICKPVGSVKNLQIVSIYRSKDSLFKVTETLLNIHSELNLNDPIVTIVDFNTALVKDTTEKKFTYTSL